jgi:V/A-type H+-transporting ATPase subunit I
MALVTMKKVYIVGPDHSREMAVDKLQELGVLHVKELAENPVDPPGELAAEVSKVERIIKKIKLAIKKSDQDIKQIHKGKGEELVEKYETIVNLKNSLEQEITGLEKEEKQLLRWGDFERKDIELLAKKGVNIRFYHASSKEIKDKGKHFLEVAFWYKQIKLRGARDNGFIVAFKDEVPEVPLETPSLPDNSLSAIRSRLEMLRKKQEESQKKYIKICQFKDKIEEHLNELPTKYDQAKVLGGIRDEDPLFAMMGFTPAKKVAKIEEDFSEDPVAVVVEDPDDDDEVPVQLHNPPIIKYFEPLIKLFNPPHYREFDPTVLVAPFLGVFFGFCLADADYGLFLLIIGGVLAPKFKKNQTAL